MFTVGIKLFPTTQFDLSKKNFHGSKFVNFGFEYHIEFKIADLQFLRSNICSYMIVGIVRIGIAQFEMKL